MSIRPARLGGPYVRALWSATRHLLFGSDLIIAGYLAYTALFAFFPFTIFLLALAGFIGQSQAAQQSIDLGLELVPPEVASVLQPAVQQVTSGSTPGLMTFGIVLTLWFASNGLESLRHALDNAYGREGKALNFVMARLQSSCSPSSSPPAFWSWSSPSSPGRSSPTCWFGCRSASFSITGSMSWYATRSAS